MEKGCFLSLLILNFFVGYTQSVGINTDASLPDASAMLDVKSSTKGMLMPRMLLAQRNAIPSPAAGLMIYQTDNTPGYYYYNGAGWEELLAGKNAWSTKGNTATNPVENFIGTTDNRPLTFRVNNQWSGAIYPVGANVFYGLQAGNSGVTGIGNTAVGQNTFSQNTTGGFNTAMGLNSLSNNILGEYNTAIGERVLQFNTSTHNTGIGAEALRQNTSGFNNTAAGSFALYNNSVGFFNSAFGYQALASNFAGTTLTALGYGADVTIDFASNATALGAGAKVDASNKVRIGNTTVTSIGGQVGWSTFSDGRYKNSIREDVKGLDFVLNLRPVSYAVDIPGLEKYLSQNNVLPAPATHHDPLKRQTGFIAQEVETAATLSGFSFSGVDRPEKPGGLYGLRYADFVVPLVKAIQEQQLVIAKLTKQAEQSDIRVIIWKQQATISNQQQQIDEMKNIITELKIEIMALKNKNSLHN